VNSDFKVMTWYFVDSSLTDKVWYPVRETVIESTCKVVGIPKEPEPPEEKINPVECNNILALVRGTLLSSLISPRR
jgi:hypothetical protein